ncbi:MAG: DNA helicase UvrD [Pseudomonadales bacterium]|nr:DNA helicase UvrD [Pseudomonadales bacterium]
MDKRLILSVAGSGKTRYIIDYTDEERRFLILTYTINNVANIRSRVAAKYGCIPKNIEIYSYFSFLYSFCFKPFLLNAVGAKGIDFKGMAHFKAVGDARYFDRFRRIYSYRLAKVLEVNGVIDAVKARIEKYFDAVLIDEVQDFGGNDFAFLERIVACTVDLVLVGDFFQHTYDTSRDGNVNKNLHADLAGYLARFEAAGVIVDPDTLGNSYRCSKSVCAFIRETMGVAIDTHRDDETRIEYVDRDDGIRELLGSGATIKLFYENGKTYPLNSKNWGDSKGEDHHQDVCVVLNKNTDKFYREGRLAELPPRTKNKLYVAITRTRNDLYLVPESKVRKLLAG